MSGRSIPLESSVRNLGVVLDSRLNWSEHIKSVCKKTNAVMYRLYHFRRSTNMALRKHLVLSLMFLLIDYCSLVYCNLSDELNLKLGRVINTGICYIYGVRKSTHITPFRRKLKWQRVATRRKFQACCFLYKLLRRGRPSYLANFRITSYNVCYTKLLRYAAAFLPYDVEQPLFLLRTVRSEL